MISIDPQNSHLDPTQTLRGSIYNTVATPTRPLTQRVSNHLKTIRDDDGYILKNKFNPMALGRDLTALYMLKYLPEEDDFIITVFGTKALEIIGFDITGEKASKLKNGQWRIKALRDILKSKEMSILHHIVGHPDDNHRLIESVYFPMKDTSKETYHILVAFDLLPGKAQDKLSGEQLNKIYKDFSTYS